MEKKFRINLLKSIDEKAKVITSYVSTFDWDRVDERFAKGAWDIKGYLSNPVILWAHNHREPPIAKAVKVEEDEIGLFKQMEFDRESEFAMRIFSLYHRGFLNAFSVGFNPKDFMMEQIDSAGKKGIVWTQVELLESSGVPIPANPGATVTREDADIITKILGDKFVKESDSNSLVFIDPNKEDMANDGLETSFKGLIDLSKSIKNQKLDEGKLTLIKTSLAVLQEIILDNEKVAISRKEFEDLQQIVQKCASIIENRHPDASVLVSKFMTQLNVAIKGYQAK